MSSRQPPVYLIKLMDVWSPLPRPTRFSEDTSSADECMRTPEGELQGPLPNPAESTPRVPQAGIETSASPDLQRKGRISKKERTPQPTLTQSKLTSILQVQPKPASKVPGTIAGPRPGGLSRSSPLKWILLVPRQSRPLEQRRRHPVEVRP